MKGKMLVGAGVLGLVAAGAVAADDTNGPFRVATVLKSFEEVPSLSTAASGFFEATVDTNNETITYDLSYEGIEGAPTHAHIHFGQPGVNAGISVFLCANVTAPAGTPPCPVGPATVSGTLTAASVIGPADRGIAPGEFAELVKALRDGFTYVNVHSSSWQAGEIRGQLNQGSKH